MISLVNEQQKNSWQTKYNFLGSVDSVIENKFKFNEHNGSRSGALETTENFAEDFKENISIPVYEQAST